MIDIYIHIVDEESHGEVSYWTSEELAREEVYALICDGYLEEKDKHLSKEEIIEEYSDVVYYHTHLINKSWLSEDE